MSNTSLNPDLTLANSAAARRKSPVQPAELAGLLAAAALLVVAFRFSSIYLGQVLILFLINAMLVMSFRLITTMGGWSFAHVAFAAIGAYSMALLTTGQGWPFWPTLLVGTLASGVLALALAYPVLRTREYNFFLATFAASAAIQQSLIQFSDITGGQNGIAFIPRPTPLFGIDFVTTGGFFGLVLVVALLVTLILLAIDRSHIGKTIKAVAENEQLSETLGVHTWGYRTLAFVIGSSIAGAAGVLLGNFNGIVNPGDFGPAFMFKIVAAAIVGGTRTFTGPLLGLIMLTLLEELFRGAAQYIPLLWGLSVIAALLFTKGGLEVVLAKAVAKLKGPRNA